MQVKIKPGNLAGTVNIPPSKSITHRAIMIASLAYGTSLIKNYLKSDDINLTIRACRELGAEIKTYDNHLIINGVNGRFSLHGKTKTLFVGESGTTLRFLMALSVLTDGTVVIDGEKKLSKRPIGELIKVLQSQGMEVKSVNNNNRAPIQIKGGRIRGGRISIPSSKSSQFASALLLISPYAQKDITLIPVSLKSQPYLEITSNIMVKFGAEIERNNSSYLIKKGKKYHGCDMKIEGDWTQASYFAVAAAVSGNTVNLTNLNMNSSQGDRKIISLLISMGCKIMGNHERVSITGGHLNAISEDLGDSPDIVPSMCIAAAFAKGKSTFTNIGHLVYKESNRLESVCLELSKMGISAKYGVDQITIIGGKPKGTVVDTHNDHRIAMSFAVAALAAEGETIISKAEVVNKSYPDFYKDLKILGAIIL